MRPRSDGMPNDDTAPKTRSIEVGMLSVEIRSKYTTLRLKLQATIHLFVSYFYFAR